MNALALKRVGAAAAVPVLLAGAGLLVAAAPSGAGAASAPAVKGIGTLNCGIGGKVKFTPALSESSSTSTTVVLSVTLKACSGSNAGATVTGGTITGTLTGTPAGDCASSGFSTTGTLTVTYVVKSGDPRLRPSTLSFNDVRSFGDADFEGEVTGAVTAGSFFNTGSFLDLQSTQSTPCRAKWTTSSSGSFEEG
jgi:hypothetical protein